ncbi:unnamed protein product [Symbiodinium natans]|uniref:Microbial-type PARG catalytic domain-containing protein n=1 Tax=Symbiodinium natans TaxID=878477 RepID=A0A812IAR3_9DINO|nr:unnamed protein product [Symbiodinium natans]
MGTVLSQANCCVRGICRSFEFFWTRVGRDKELTQSLTASSSGGSAYQTVGPLPVQVVEQEPVFGEHRLERPRCSFGNRCRRSNPDHFLRESHPTDPDNEADSLPVPSVQPGQQLAQRDGNFAWIRMANEKADRELRMASASLSLDVCQARGYQLGNARVALRQVEKLLQGTRILTVEEAGGSLASNAQPRLSVASEPTAFDAALARSARGERVAVVGAASAYHPCGGFRTGGRHALEEAMCVQSSLSISLQRAVWLSRHGAVQVTLPERLKADGRQDWFCYIPERGAILSPSVEVFRAGSDTGYAFLKSAVELAAVVSVAMPNMNPSVKDSPLDAPSDLNAYRALLADKLKAALYGASLAGATTIVVPGVGCGVFKNDPSDVGAALAEAIRSAGAGLREVVLAGVPQSMASAAAAPLGQRL